MYWRTSFSTVKFCVTAVCALDGYLMQKKKFFDCHFQNECMEFGSGSNHGARDLQSQSEGIKKNGSLDFRRRYVDPGTTNIKIEQREQMMSIKRESPSSSTTTINGGNKIVRLNIGGTRYDVSRSLP